MRKLVGLAMLAGMFYVGYQIGKVHFVHVVKMDGPDAEYLRIDQNNNWAWVQDPADASPFPQMRARKILDMLRSFSPQVGLSYGTRQLCEPTQITA